MSVCLADIGGVTSSTFKLIHFGSQFTSKGSFERWQACFQFSYCKICWTFAANSCDGLPQFCLVKRVEGEPFNHLLFLGSDAVTCNFFPSMILLRVSNTTLSDQFSDITFQIIVSDCFPMPGQNFSMLSTSENPMDRPFNNVVFVLQRCAISNI